MFRSRPLRFLGVCALALAAGCASSASRGATGGADASATAADAGVAREALSVRYRTYSNGLNLALVNPAHSDRTELYSKTVALSEAGTKVTTDEVLEATIEELERLGLFELTQPGPAPASAAGTNPQSIEVLRDGRTVHALLTRESSTDAKRAFHKCATVFCEIYTATYQLQSVKETPDWESQNQNVQKRAQKGG